MGLTKKLQVDGCLESEGKKWVIAGISLRAPLRKINTNRKDDGDNDEDGCSTTPTSEEAKISDRLPCPPPPRKRRPTSRCHLNGVREFFTPPDLESVFIPLVERAN